MKKNTFDEHALKQLPKYLNYLKEGISSLGNPDTVEEFTKKKELQDKYYVASATFDALRGKISVRQWTDLMKIGVTIYD